jgi:hypothetical protein
MMTIARLLLSGGLACLVMVVLTHVAESFHIFPGMGWGLPNSAGHYIDLVSAILAGIMLPLGLMAIAVKRREKGLHRKK